MDWRRGGCSECVKGIQIALPLRQMESSQEEVRTALGQSMLFAISARRSMIAVTDSLKGLRWALWLSDNVGVCR